MTAKLPDYDLLSALTQTNKKGPSYLDALANFRVLDELNFVNRYKWVNLPSGIDGQLLERILYYKRKGCLFYVEQLNKFYFLPFATQGKYNVYGRADTYRPLIFGGSSQDKDVNFMDGLTRKPIYSINEILNVNAGDVVGLCVPLVDYTPQLSTEGGVPRQQLQEPILNMMSETLSYGRTNLLSHSGVTGVRVGSEDEAGQISDFANQVNNCAKTGRPYVPMLGKIDFQEIQGTGTANATEYLQFLQALDNLRLSLLGLDNGGLFQKKSHMLESEQAMNAGIAKSVLTDGLKNRQRFCDIANILFGLDIWCEIDESAIKLDENGDGKADGGSYKYENISIDQKGGEISE